MNIIDCKTDTLRIKTITHALFNGKLKVIKFALLINIFVQIGLKAQRYIQYLTKFKINNNKNELIRLFTHSLIDLKGKVP